MSKYYTLKKNKILQPILSMKLKKIESCKVNVKTATLLFLFSFTLIFGQINQHHVINSAGNNWTLPNGTTISDNVGEPFVSTISNSGNMITQGFLQEFRISPFFTVTELHNGVSCKDKNDGNISLAITSNVSTYTAQYFWLPQQNCATNNCSALDSLKAGIYNVKVKIFYTVNSQIKIDSSNTITITINDALEPCKVKIYKGITVNGDGNNDVLTIDNISEFPNNHIYIYNRWGQLLYEETGYNNITKSWPQNQDKNNLTSTTYFYILNLGDGSNSIKGWVEVLKD